ncbi:MAG: TonB-dependent receptor plug domain-containing protein, partial [Candidatus Zixiibacteriota bacterium]
PTSDLNMEDVFAGYEPSSAEVLQQKKHLQKTPYLDSYNPRNSIDLQGSISGPVPFTNKRLTYFMSARYLDETGFEYGKRLFMPWGFQAPLGDTEHTFPLADNELVALWPWKSISTQSKLFFQLSPSINMSYGLYYSDTEGKSGDSHAFKYVPDGRRNSYTTAQTHIFSLNHTLSSKTFYELKATYFDKDYKSYLYEDPFDYRYMPVKVGDILQFVYDVQNNEDIELTLNAFDFNFFGNDVFRSKNRVKFKSVRFDLTSQVDKWNQVKLGASGRLHDLFNEWYSLQFSEVDYRPIIPGRSSRHFNTYSHKPKEFAAYIQDKIEINDIIINFGLRFDYFDSDGKVLADPSDPQIYDPFNPYHKYKDFDPEVPLDEQTEFTVVEREAFWWKKASAKSQLSPRFGISFPISADAAVHFSYGHFFQNPEFSRLYHNPNFWVEGSGSQSLVGNADLNAERTVMYEVGLQQRVTEALTFNVTGFYRDIRDWIGISSVIASYNARGDYYKYINKDHAVGKGITLASKLRTSHISANLDYTFMTAKGTHSDPVDAWFDIQEGHAPRVELVNLDWDQRHTLNAVVTYQNRGWTASLVSEYRSGLPYTPRFTIAEVAGGSAFIGLRENSSFKPSTFNVDLRLSKRFRYRGLNYDVLLYVYNLFDIRNPKSVFPDTGSPDYTLDTINLVDRNQGTVDIEVSDVSEFNTHAGFYQPPRFIQIGLSVNL